MARKEWHPGKPKGTPSMTPWVAEQLEEAIEGQREITGYEGPDEGWDMHVANTLWPVDTYQHIGYNSGYLAAFLELAFVTDVKLPPGLRERAEAYIYR